MYSIKLADGTELTNLELNGNNFISNTIVDDNIFKDNLGNVTITSPEGVVEYEDMKLIQNKVYGTQSWFILAEKTKEERDREQQEAVTAGLAYELVAKDLAIQSLEQTQADTLYQLMVKGVI
jgi:hypothetical protein